MQNDFDNRAAQHGFGMRLAPVGQRSPASISRI
jgi:hypothetical protein